MEWMNAVEEMLQRYSGQRGGPAPGSADPHSDFQKVATSAPPTVVASGISQAFQSDQTPPFPQMLANLFSNSNPNQRAGLLNQLLSSLGPAAVAGLPHLGSLLQGRNVTPEQANEISANDVEQIATHAQSRNPSIVDQVSHFYAQHPDVMKAAGGLALTIALQHMLRR
jgi:hypothetical protein